MSTKGDYEALLRLKTTIRSTQGGVVTGCEAYELMFTLYSTRISCDLQRDYDDSFTFLLRQSISMKLSYERFLSIILSRGIYAA